MTNREALQSLTTYPIPVNNIDKICIDRGLVAEDTYTVEIGITNAFQLASADVCMWMYSAPSITEQDLGMSVVERSNWRDKANVIYGQLGAPEFTGTKYGFIGESF